MEKRMDLHGKGSGMKLRLKEEGEDALITYMRKAHKSMSWLAREADMTRTGVDDIVKGKTKRSQTENLVAISKALGLKMGNDADGLYFYVENGDEVGQSKGLVDLYGDALGKNIKKLTPDQRRAAEEFVDLLLSPDDRDILRLVLDAMRLKRDRRVM